MKQHIKDANLKQLIEYSGLSHSEISRQADISRPTLNKWVNHLVAPHPLPSQIPKLAKTLKVPVYKLLDALIDIENCVTDCNNTVKGVDRS